MAAHVIRLLEGPTATPSILIPTTVSIIVNPQLFFFWWNFCACETNVVAAVGHQFETTAIYYSQQTLEW